MSNTAMPTSLENISIHLGLDRFDSIEEQLEHIQNNNYDTIRLSDVESNDRAFFTLADIADIESLVARANFTVMHSTVNTVGDDLLMVTTNYLGNIEGNTLCMVETFNNGDVLDRTTVYQTYLSIKHNAVIVAFHPDPDDETICMCLVCFNPQVNPEVMSHMTKH